MAARAPQQFGLFGGAAPARAAKPISAPARGYAAAPGTGPAGETCGSCGHCRKRIMRNGRTTFFKCVLQILAWTSGRGSDVLVRSPACEKWKPGKPRTTDIYVRPGGQ